MKQTITMIIIQICYIILLLLARELDTYTYVIYIIPCLLLLDIIFVSYLKNYKMYTKEYRINVVLAISVFIISEFIYIIYLYFNIRNIALFLLSLLINFLICNKFISIIKKMAIEMNSEGKNDKIK